MINKILIFGPTCSGKTLLAEQIADQLGAYIINADSMQIYKEIPILTAQPKELTEKYKLYSFIKGDKNYSVAEWLKDVNQLIANAEKENKDIIIVGGTGLYLKSLITGMKELPETTVEQKLVIDALVKNKGTKTLYEQIIAKDEEYKNYISPNDIQRVSRIYSLLFFHNISHSKYLNLPNITNFKSEDFFTIYLNPDRKKLYEKINNRVDQMIKEGLMAEIKAFFKKNYIANNNIYKAIGIKELEGFINSKQYQLEEELYNSGEKQNIEIIELIKKNTRNYAKRQVTFFNHQIKSDLTLENYIGWNG